MRHSPLILQLTLVSIMTTTASVQAGMLRDGAQVQIRAGKHDARYAPVRIEIKGDLPNGPLALELEDGDCLPLQAQGQALVAIVPQLTAGQTLTATLRERDCGQEGVSVKETSSTSTRVEIDGELFTTYHHDPAERKPYLHPVIGPGGHRMTRAFPMEEIEGEPRDHPHHRSMYVAYGDLNGADCWSEGAGSGYQRPVSLQSESGPVFGSITAVNEWLNNQEEPVVRESRTYTFYNTPAGARIADVSITFVAAHGPVDFGDTKEGGIFAVRVNPAINGSGAGTLRNASGAVGESDVWGKPSPWVDNSGPIDGLMCGIAIFDAPGNLRHPTTWHARDYGLIGANCFGLSYFTHGKKRGDYQLDSGEELTFLYRVFIHEGDADEAAVAHRYQDFAAPPAVTVAATP